MTAEGFRESSSDPNEYVDIYFTAVYWAIATVTTTGYGDIAPVTGSLLFNLKDCAMCAVYLIYILRFVV